MKRKINNLIYLLLPVFLFNPLLNANTTRDIGQEPDLNKKVIVQWIIFYTNIERAKKGLSPLAYDPVLEKAAEWQAEYCTKLQNLSHIAGTAGMKTPKDRMENFGRRCGFCGENLTVKFSINSEGIPVYARKDNQGTYYDFGSHTIYWRNERQMAYAMVDSWMKSKHHRDNILNPGFLWIGTGTSKGIFNNNKSYYGCQVFNGYGGLPPGFIKTEYKLSGLKTEKGTTEGKEAYLASYEGKLEPVIIEISGDSQPVQHKIIKKGNQFIFIKKQKIKGDLFASLYDKETKMLYPVLLLK